MSNFRIIPRLEIKSGNLIKGIRMEGLRIVGNPGDYALNYLNNGADEIIIDDIVASLYSRKFDYRLLNTIVEEIDIPITLQGGIKNIDDIYKALEHGADKVSINTGAILNPKLIHEAARVFGSQCITICIQGKRVFEDKWEVFSESGRNRHYLDLFEWIKKIQDLGAGEIFFISIDHDGLAKGIDREIIEKIHESSYIPLIIGGGISNLSDINYLLELGIDGCVMSKFLYDKSNSINDIKNSLTSERIDLR